MPERTVPLPEPEHLRAIVEALVFAAEEPLTVEDLGDIFPGAPADTLLQALDDVIRFWEGSDRGLQVIRIAGGCRMTTRPEHGEWVRALFRARNRRRLSPAALETLAIVAYRQPITTPEIQALRGTDPGGVLQTLLDRRLLRVVGRKKVVGKPLMYGTTQEFLTHFGLNSLTDLPTLEEFGAVAAQLARQPLPATDVALAGAGVDGAGADDEGGPFEEDDDDAAAAEEFDDATEDDREREDDGDDS